MFAAFRSTLVVECTFGSGIPFDGEISGMKRLKEVIETTMKKYADDLPWGIYMYNISGGDLSHFGNVQDPEKYVETEKYIADVIGDVCQMAADKKGVYTETSPSGLVYIAVPLFIDNQIWAVLSAYLSLGREGSWRRSLNRGPSVSQTVNLLEELGFIISTHQEVQKWFRPSFEADDESQKEESAPENEVRSYSKDFVRW
jgi:hypothetical protein